MSKNELSRLELIEKLRKQRTSVNARINRIQKKFGDNSWAVSRLYDRIKTDKFNHIKNSGTIRTIDKNLNLTQLRMLDKAMNNFLNSETSKIKGIKDVRERTIKTLQKSLGVEDNITGKIHKLSYKESEFLYNMLNDKDVDKIVGKIGASEFWALYQDSKELTTSEEFIEKIKNSTDLSFSNDSTINENLLNIFDKYLSK